MMAWMAATLLALLLNYLASSQGHLSPPLNLSVELLDFKAWARWLPGPGNPKGTRYFLEFIDIVQFSVSPWRRAGNCTNITSTQCYLILNQRIMTEYFFRVMAEWKGEHSEWAFLPQSFQPYAYTILSAPNLTVSTEHFTIWILLSHPVQSLTDVHMKFSVDLFSMISNSTEKKHIGQNITTRSSRFVDLPSGTYCINASAFLTASSKCNNNATTCVSLNQDQRERKVWVVNSGILLLMSIPFMIGLIFLYRYVKAFNIGYIPKALSFIGETGRVLASSLQELRVLSFSRICPDEDAQHETSEDSSQGHCGGVLGKDTTHESNEKSKGLFSLMVDKADQNKPPAPNLYSTAAKMERSTERLTQTNHHAFSSTPRTSFSDTSAKYSQNKECEYTLDLDLDVFDEYSRASCESLEPEDSCEEETESQRSDDLFGNYEPRPDPRCMIGD